MTVAELIAKLTDLQGEVDRPMPVLVYNRGVEAYVNADATIINLDKPRPYVVIQ